MVISLAYPGLIAFQSGTCRATALLIRHRPLWDGIAAISIAMVIAGVFASFLFIGLVLADWLYFVRLTPDAIRYGCRVASSQDQWGVEAMGTVRACFDAEGLLRLPHGVARFYPDRAVIAIRPQYRLFSMGFRTAWPLKGLIHLSLGEQTLTALCVKRIPWSSALITLLWFATVLLGSLAFVVIYAEDGGFSSLQGTLLGIGLVAGATLVLITGLVTVILSYRLENGRLTKVYEELRETLERSPRC
ncbi:MAG: hypothetical protein NNA23_07570 [Nitrospira sp.]|nr:hypothetical protein [Nitrospira sp.]